MTLSYSFATTSYEPSSSSTQLIFSIGFVYDDPSEVKVRTQLTSGTYQDVTNWTFFGTTSIEFTSTPPSNFQIYRDTDLSKSYGPPGYSVFNSGSQLNASDLNGNFELLRRGIEENADTLNEILFGSTGFDATYVNVIGDKMVGDLELGTASTVNTTLSTDGSALFASDVGIGGTTTAVAINASSLTTTGAVVAGSGVVFSGSANTSNRTLDDYEFGTWTPTLPNHPDATFPSNAITVGEFERIGPLVTIHFRLRVDQVLGSGADYVINGLPFTNVTGTNVTQRVGSVVPVNGFNVSPTVGGFSLILDGQDLKINKGASGTGSNLSYVNHTDTQGQNVEFIGSISYYCAALT